MAELAVSLGNSVDTVTATLASGVAVTAGHPNLHVEERDMMELIRRKAIIDSPGASAVVYSNTFRGSGYNKPLNNTTHHTWTCDGVGDQVEIQAAIDAVAADGGGSVLLLGPLFIVSAAIKLRTGVYLRGEGLGTILRASAAYTTDLGMIMLYDNTAHATKLSDLTLHGNGQSAHGVHYIANGGQVFSTPDPSTNPDPAHIIRDLYIYQMGNSSFAGHGMQMQGANLRAGKYSDIRMLTNRGCGVWINGSVDSHYTNIEVGSSGSGGPTASSSSTAPVGHGFYVSQGDNNMFTANKAWFSRFAGFYNRGTRNGYANCQAQDNYGHGFQDVYGKTSFANCHADSNGQSQDSGIGQAGFALSGGYTTVVGCQSYDKAESGTAWQQQHGFLVTSGLTYSRIESCTAYGNAVAKVTGTPGTDTVIDVAGP